MWCSSNHWSTPISLNADAPPPPSARPIEGLLAGTGGRAAGEVEKASVGEPALGFDSLPWLSTPELLLSFAPVTAAALEAEAGVG